MAVLERECAPLTYEDIQEIVDPAEKEFARLLKIKNPELVIFHEPTFFTIENEEGIVSGTIPDFSTINSTGRVVYWEITLERHRKKGIPKRKQRRIMRTVAPEIPYILVTGEDLERMQERNKSFTFFKETS